MLALAVAFPPVLDDGGKDWDVPCVLEQQLDLTPDALSLLLLLALVVGATNLV